MSGALPAPGTAAYRDGERSRPALVWRFDQPMLAVASTPLGGGIGTRHWIVNAQVALDYARTDLEAHLAAIGAELGCVGAGVGFLTAAAIDDVTSAVDGAVAAYATVGLRHPTLAAAPDDGPPDSAVGTVNIVVGVPVRLTQSALVNAVITCTEAKTQALRDRGVPATGTASDAVCVVCPAVGPAEQFAGPRAPVGARIARAVHAAVGRGTVAEWAADRDPGS
ncbi:MAG: adenosylcobinamide amidohydrolase [Acidimicrobiia bacterium]